MHDSLALTFPHHDSRLTERQQDVFKLSQHHGAVLHLVVQLQALNEVLEVASFLGLLDVAVDWVELAGQKKDKLVLERADSKKTWKSACWVQVCPIYTQLKGILRSLFVPPTMYNITAGWNVIKFIFLILLLLYD